MIENQTDKGIQTGTDSQSIEKDKKRNEIGLQTQTSEETLSVDNILEKLLIFTPATLETGKYYDIK